jgi:hypothetical protein
VSAGAGEGRGRDVRRARLARRPLRAAFCCGLAALLLFAAPACGGSDGEEAEPGGPYAPAVYLLGGSSARECLQSNAEWAEAIREAGGPELLAVGLGASNQSFSADRRLVRGMPEGALAIVGVNLGRFTSAPPRELAGEPLDEEARAALAGEREIHHRYDRRAIRTEERKRELLSRWLDERYELYRRNYEANLEELERLLEDCRDAGLRAAVLELPLDLDLVGDALDTPRRRYVEDARRLAAAHGAAFVSFLDEIELASTDFFDLMHLVEPGRERWQERLSREIVPLLSGAATLGGSATP